MNIAGLPSTTLAARAVTETGTKFSLASSVMSPETVAVVVPSENSALSSRRASFRVSSLSTM